MQRRSRRVFGGASAGRLRRKLGSHLTIPHFMSLCIVPRPLHQTAVPHYRNGENNARKCHCNPGICVLLLGFCCYLPGGMRACVRVSLQYIPSCLIVVKFLSQGLFPPA